MVNINIITYLNHRWRPWRRRKKNTAECIPRNAVTSSAPPPTERETNGPTVDVQRLNRRLKTPVTCQKTSRWVNGGVHTHVMLCRWSRLVGNAECRSAVPPHLHPPPPPLLVRCGAGDAASENTGWQPLLDSTLLRQLIRIFKRYGKIVCICVYSTGDPGGFLSTFQEEILVVCPLT